jgi:hypothetical protein
MDRTLCAHGNAVAFGCEDCAWEASGASRQHRLDHLVALAGQAYIGLSHSYPRSDPHDLAIKATSVAFHILGRIERMTKTTEQQT